MNFRYFFLAHRSSHMTMFLIQNCTSITSTVKNCEQNSIDNLFRYFSLFGSSFSTVISTREVDFLILKYQQAVTLKSVNLFCVTSNRFLHRATAVASPLIYFSGSFCFLLLAYFNLSLCLPNLGWQSEGKTGFLLRLHRTFGSAATKMINKCCCLNILL
jgi:hypothetical protein